jgi:hypothetical protein
MRDAKTFSDLRLVQADNETQARDKYESYWSDQGSPHDDSYWAMIEDISEMIT